MLSPSPFFEPTRPPTPLLPQPQPPIHCVCCCCVCCCCVCCCQQINPCNSPLHPAVQAGIQPEGGEELSVQSAYTPKSQCFGCGETGGCQQAGVVVC